jgi:hypothetical protein
MHLTLHHSPVGPFTPGEPGSEARHMQVAPGNGIEVCPRYPVGLRLFMKWGDEERYRSATDVSREGMFVESPDQAAVESMLQVRTTLPGGLEFSALCAVERVVTAGDAAFCGGLPGMGLRFLAMGEGLEDSWEEYLTHLKDGTLPEPVDLERSEHNRPAPVKLTRRTQPRRTGRLEVRLRNVPGLDTLHTINVSRGGMFIGTSDPLDPGERFSLQVVHPVTGSTQVFDVEVRWVRAAGHDPGMGVRIVEDDDEGSFVRFVNEG